MGSTHCFLGQGFCGVSCSAFFGQRLRVTGLCFNNPKGKGSAVEEGSILRIPRQAIQCLCLLRMSGLVVSLESRA